MRERIAASSATLRFMTRMVVGLAHEVARGPRELCRFSSLLSAGLGGHTLFKQLVDELGTGHRFAHHAGHAPGARQQPEVSVNGPDVAHDVDSKRARVVAHFTLCRLVSYACCPPVSVRTA